MKTGIIGAGNVGTAVGILLARRGCQIAGVASRTSQSALKAAQLMGAPVMAAEELARKVDMLFITTNDASISCVCGDLAKKGCFHPGQVVIHMSGSLTTEVLEPARVQGAHVLSVHPLQSCASVERALSNLPGSVFSIEGDPAAYPVAERLVNDLGGEFFYISKEAKPLYHAAACVASNYLVTLVDLSYRLMKAAGMPEDFGVKALMPLIQGTLGNIQGLGIPKALTGPIARGDHETILDHLVSMRRHVPQLEPLYVALGGNTVSLAEQKGSLTHVAAEVLRKLFFSAMKEAPLYDPQLEVGLTDESFS